MKWMDDLKSLMYSNCKFDTACAINDIIFEYDKQRATTDQQVLNAGKEWHYRLSKMCDFRAGKNETTSKRRFN